MLNTLNPVALIYPEILLCIALIISVLFNPTKLKNLSWFISLSLIISGIFYLLRFQNITDKTTALNGMFIFDPLSALFKFIVLFLTALIVLGSMKYMQGFIHKNEFIIIILSAVIAAMFLISANDLIVLFVALETLSLSSILLAGYSKYDTRSNEASIKYLLNTAGASGLFLFGLSLVYGICGATRFDEIKYKLLSSSINQASDSSIISIALILIISGIAFKLASAPFHMWSPDVYEGSPTPATAFLSTISKLAAFAIAIRLFVGLFNSFSAIWQPVIMIISVLSMIIGNLTALGEVLTKASIKRLMAYSSIAQIGYVLIGPALGTQETISSSTFYLIIYSIMNLGAFLCIIAFGNESNSDSIRDYAGLAKAKPLLALGFSICLINLAGLPLPPAGFIAKFILFKTSFETGTAGVFLATIALITTIMSVFYYSYIIKLMVVDQPSQAVLEIGTNKESIGKSLRLNTAIVITIVSILVLSFTSNNLLNNTDKASLSCFYDTKHNYISAK